MPKYKRGTHQRWYKRRPTYVPKQDKAEESSSDESPPTPPTQIVEEEMEEEVTVVEAPEPIVESEVISPPPRKSKQLQLNSWIPMPPGYKPPAVPKKPKKAKGVKFALGNTVPWDRPQTPNPDSPTPEEHYSSEEEHLFRPIDIARNHAQAMQTAFDGSVAEFSARIRHNVNNNNL